MKKLLIIGLMMITSFTYAKRQDTLTYYAREYYQWNEEKHNYEFHGDIDVTYLTVSISEEHNIIYTTVKSNVKTLVTGAHYIEIIKEEDKYTTYIVASSQIGPYAVRIYKDGLTAEFDYWWDNKEGRMNISSLFNLY